jgi:WD40 repeat protein
MEVRQMHSYALVGSETGTQYSSLIDRLSAQPVRKVSKSTSIGTVKTGFTCMMSVSDKDRPMKNVFICGHSSGALYVWRRQRFVANADPQEKGGPEAAITPSSAHDQLRDHRFIHKGPVTVLKMQPNTQFVYSGASDRDIKLWDIFDPEHPPCLRQTFSGHGGSITAIEFAPLMGQHPGYMMTGSTDKKVIVWKNAEGRDMMMYPFYIKMRVIDLKIWPTCLCFLSTTRLVRGRVPSVEN